MDSIRAAVSNVSIWTLPLHDMMTALVPPGSWYWAQVTSVTPVTQSLIQLHERRIVANYLKKRDEYRAERNEEPRWEGSSLALARRCWKQMSGSFWDSNVMLRHVLDKYWHGRNRAKQLWTAGDRAISRCHVCGAADSQIHMITNCMHPSMVSMRLAAQDLVIGAVAQLYREREFLSTYQSRVVQFMVKYAFDEEYEDVDRLWTGAWNLHMLREALIYNGKLMRCIHCPFHIRRLRHFSVL